jgi:hypothetical protein
MSVTLDQVDGRIGSALRFIDVYLVLDRIFTKLRTDTIKAEHGTISAYMKTLFEKYQVSELSLRVYVPNGSSPKHLENITVTSDLNTTQISGVKESSQPEQEEKPIQTTVKELKQPMENNQYSFLALQNEMIRNAYETLKKDYDNLQQKFNKSDDELRVAKTNLAIADGMKDMAVLQGTVAASSSLGGLMKDALKPENADGLAKLVHAFKGTNGEGSAAPAIFNGLNQVQKDSLQALADVIKTISPEETEAMVGVVILASKDPGANWFSKVKTGMETELLTSKNS